MVSHKVQLLASLLLISEVYTQYAGRNCYGNQQVGRLQPPTSGQFIIPAIIKPLPYRPPSAPFRPPSAPSQPRYSPRLTNDVIAERLLRLLICDIIENDNVGVDVDVKEEKKNDVKEGKKNVDVKEEENKNDVTNESKEPEICVFIRPCNC
ncbi:uncharacterized protein LOC134748859 [Cydia strobilella]|uniref:uncharacterized protein LOC134748859 n=1 Tax=Cydia strobilella TaxID=1100964 RepID=UPI0030058B8B